MSVLGVVAEFNPFHNGHGYLLEQAKNHLGDFESVICVMSGNFLQRGQPAMCNKWARAQMAILGGADLVLELPFCFAVRSAYYFARGAVELLARTGVVTHIAFGSEHGNLQNLQEISQIITEEPEEFQQQLKKQLSLGLSFPVARAKALEQYFSNIDGIAEILSAPNNILALEYLRIIQEQKLPLIPITIKRTGTSYHSDELSAFASATAIRNGLMTFGPEKIHPFLPESSFNIIQQEISCGRCPVFVDSLEQIILARLRLISTRELSEILDVTEGLENRFKDAAAFSASLKDLLAAVKSKRYSLTRINRSLLYILFNLTKKTAVQFDAIGPLYIHPLAFNSHGQQILQKINEKSSLKLLNRGKDLRKALNGPDEHLSQMLRFDVCATDIYSLLYPSMHERMGGSDFTLAPIRI